MRFFREKIELFVFVRMIVTILLTTIVYLVLQRIDDNRRERNNMSTASWGARFGLLFFVAIVCFVGVFLIENMYIDQHNNSAFIEGSTYEHGMLKSINEPIHTGFPPF